MDYNYNYSTDLTTTTADTGAIAALVAFFAAYTFVIFLIGIFYVVCMWKIFVKAGKPGWASIVPIYNIIVLLEIVGRPVWWLLLFFVPFVNFVIGIMLMIDLAKAFGKDVGFAILLILLPIVGYPMLAFGKADYVGPAVAK
jgi:hypothetical protein